jgi:AraC-like DNA-binding protein
VADRLRDLIDLVLASLDDPGAGGEALARRASFSRDHLDRILSAATGETPVGLRRRLLLERAAWQLREGVPASEAATAAGYGSSAAFSRAFSRAHGVSPRGFAASGRPTAIEAPNGVHFLAPAGLLVPRWGRDDVVAGEGTFAVPGPPSAGIPSVAVPGPPSAGIPSAGRPGPHLSGGPTGCSAPPAPHRPRDLTERMVRHHLTRTRELLDAAATVPAGELARPLRPGFRAVWFEGEEPDAATMASRLVGTLEVWVAAIRGEGLPDSALPDGRTAPHDASGRPPTIGDLRARLEGAGAAFSAVARRIRDGDAWDDAFVDALCEPPQAFTYGGVLAHVLTYGAIRREMLASVLVELGATVPSSGDPIEWEAGR